MADVLPPQNIEAEEAVLGSMLIEPECIARISAIVEAQDFYIVRNQWVCAAIYANGANADLLTVSDTLVKDKRLDETGGGSYLARLMTSVPTALNVEAYARIVADFATRRRLLTALTATAKAAYDISMPIDEVCGISHQQLNNVYKSADRSGATLPERSDEFIEWLNDDSPSELIPCGIKDFDAVVGGGFARGEYVIVAAPPGVGKTAIAVQAMYLAAQRGQNCMYFSFEVSWKDIACRMIAMKLSETGHNIHYGKIIKRDLTSEQRELCERGWLEMVDKFKSRIKIHDPSSMTPDQIRNAAISYGAKHPLDMIIVDQMHHMSDGRKGSDDRQRLSFISRELAKLPKVMREATSKTPVVIALSRLSRSGYEQPDISHLKESGDIESDANMVLLAYRDPDDKPSPGQMPKPDGKLFLKIGKNRNGLTNLIVPCTFRGAINRIT